MNKRALLIGTIFGLLSVLIGAFGAHGLKEVLLANDKLDVFETAVKYQIYHAFALLFVGLLADRIKGEWVNKVVFFFTSGVIVFSGSLYVLSLTNIGIFGAITPIGGLMFVAGWIQLIICIVKGAGN